MSIPNIPGTSGGWEEGSLQQNHQEQGLQQGLGEEVAGIFQLRKRATPEQGQPRRGTGREGAVIVPGAQCQAGQGQVQPAGHGSI